MNNSPLPTSMVLWQKIAGGASFRLSGQRHLLRGRDPYLRPSNRAVSHREREKQKKQTEYMLEARKSFTCDRSSEKAVGAA